MLTALFGYITSRLIVQRVCKEQAPVMYPINLPLALAAAHAVLSHHFPRLVPAGDAHLVLKVIGVLALVQCALFFYELNNELTAYLGIHTFRLSKKPWSRKSKPAAAKAKAKQSPSPSPAKRRAAAASSSKSPSPAKRHQSPKAAKKSQSPRRSRSPRRPEAQRLREDIAALPIRSEEDSPRRQRGRSRSRGRK